jgi:hypothetical protein
MVRAVEELLDGAEGGAPPKSTAADARVDLEIAVAFHFADRSGGRVPFPVADTDYTIRDPWGRSAGD